MHISEKEKYKIAKKRVEEIKGFYVHMTIYLIVNLILFLFAANVFNGLDRMHFPSWGHFTTPFFWGIGLFFHGLKAFRRNITPIKKWEERKIKEYLEKEESDLDRFSGKR